MILQTNARPLKVPFFNLLDCLQTLVRNVRSGLVVQSGGGVVVPEEVDVLRYSAVDLAVLNVVDVLETVLNELGVVLQRARVTRTILAVVVGDDGLVEDDTDKGVLLGVDGGIALKALKDEMSAHGHDVTDLVGVGEWNSAIKRYVLLRYTNTQSIENRGDVRVVSTT